MLHIRKAMNIVDSYQNDTNTEDARLLTQNINLDLAGFEEENQQLAAQYVLPEGSSQRAVIKLYTEGSDVNNELIQAEGIPHNMNQRYQSEYFALMMLNNRVALAETHHVYSGTGTFNPTTIMENGVFETPAFLSTSISIKVAVKTTNYRRDEEESEVDKMFAAMARMDANEEDHVLHFILPPGFKNGFYIAPYSVDPEELEFLLMPKVQFKHVKSLTVDLQGVQRTFHTFIPV